jgi:DNA-directed RNA polymerase subunit RPC12/RpoP
MMPLCDVLAINVNELLSGQFLDEKSYHQKAEENIMKLIEEKKEAKKKLIIATIVAMANVLCGFVLMLLAAYVDLKDWVKGVLILLGFLVMLGGIGVACVLEREAGVYECKSCGEQFIPTMKAYLIGSHYGTTRKLKCPKCGKKTYCKKRLAKDEREN